MSNFKTDFENSLTRLQEIGAALIIILDKNKNFLVVLLVDLEK